MQRTLLALAAVTVAGVAHAQTMPGYTTPSDPMAPGMQDPRGAQAAPGGDRLDPRGQPFVGRNDWVRQPGDRPGPGGAPAGQGVSDEGLRDRPGQNASLPEMATAPRPSMRPSMGPSASEAGQSTFRDEYGFRYDSEGNRLDSRGNVISPHTR